MFSMEICVDSVDSALNAVEGGALRLELCSALLEGGLTPSVGLFLAVKDRISSDIPIYVMIRPRVGSDFAYSHSEIDVMKKDVLHFKALGAKGFVFGALTPEGNVDKKTCLELLEAAGLLPCTFHRAFDIVYNYEVALETIIELGFQRILTSGLAPTAFQGLETIRKLIQISKNRIIIVAGGGINENNVKEIAGTGIKEMHGSAKKAICLTQPSTRCISFGTNDSKLFVTDKTCVAKLVALFKEVQEEQNCNF